MIAYLDGTILERVDEGVVVLCGGVGYCVAVPTRIVEQCRRGASVQLMIHHDSREGFNDLYGFLTREDLQMFQMLLRVSRVGPKSALELLSRADGATIRAAIHSGDPAMLRDATRVGLKTAQRIVTELASKLGSEVVLPSSQRSVLIDALLGLGYRDMEAQEAVATVDASAPEEDQLKAALAFFNNRA